LHLPLLVFVLSLQSAALIIFVDYVIPIEHGSCHMAANFHTVFFVVSRPTKIANSAAPHIVGQQAHQPCVLATAP
jgi:hypothetical protein